MEGKGLEEEEKKKEARLKGREAGKSGNKAGVGIDSRDQSSSEVQAGLFIDSPAWLSTKDAAIYLRKFRKIDGQASDGAIRTAIWRKAIRAKKWRGRLYIRRADLDLLLQNAPFASGGY